MKKELKTIIFIAYAFILICLFYYYILMSDSQSSELNSSDKIEMQKTAIQPDYLLDNNGCKIAHINANNIQNLLLKSNVNINSPSIISTDSEQYFYQNGDSVLTYTNETLHFSTSFYNKISQYFGANLNIKSENIINQLTDLSFMSKREAYQEIRKILNALNISLDNTSYDCYVLDYEMLKRIAKESPGFRIENEISEQDECYYFTIRQTIVSFPVIINYMNTFTELTSETAPIQVLCSKNGIEYLHIEHFYDIKVKKSSTNLKSFEEIRKNVLYKYSQLLNASFYEVKSVDFAYVLLENKKDLQLIPVWVFTITEDNSQSSYQYQELYNALTAEEIVL